ncbi:hypothetical protein KPL71_001373 [Citrus sinensis]|uniref:Uncharacterized protein n=1 Tax=Citrus sinensis TaxID=2711 RepID=A0ACB8NW61_CITSI|nr:hypothetical protein KPL71_001373 [Citrus sinensis]
MTHTLFWDNPLPPPPKPKPKPKSQPRPVTFHPPSISIPGQHSPGHTLASPPVPPPSTKSQPHSQSKDKQSMHQFSAHVVDHSPTTDDQTSDSNLAVSDSHTETDTESLVSTSDSEKSYADITRILMAQPDQPPQGQTSHTEPYVDIPSEVEEEMPKSSATNQPPPAQAQTSPPNQKSSNGPWFTFDDLLSHKWHDRLNEMSAWIDLQMLRPGATTQSVLREFTTRFTGALRDWFDSLGRYRQLQFMDLPEVSSALAVLHDQFLGDPSAVFEVARRDYLNMKCCSFNAKDFDFHYKQYELQPDIQRQLTASNLVLDNISLGKIFQLAKTYLDKLCEQKQFFKELLKDKKPFRSACKKPYLQIKCKKKKDCDCSPKKKRHFKKFRNPDNLSRPRRSRKPYRFFRKKSSSSRDFKRRKSSRCFICKKKGHYAKYCPNKREKSIRLVKHLQATTDYSPEKDELEFYFSEQDEPNDETMFALQNSSDDSDNDQSQAIFHQQLLSLDTTIPIPSIKLQILPLKFQRPISAIGLIDIGAQRSMLNPHILPPEYWTEYEEQFKAVNGKLFTTSLITKKPIGIQNFPNCVIWTKVIGSTLPNKDLLLDYSPENDELEFYFSEQDEPNDETVFALQNSSDDSDSDQSQAIFHQQLLSLDTTIPIPSIKLQILPLKFQRPIPTIDLIDTGAQRSMLNPHILPPEYWTEYEEHFKAVNVGRIVVVAGNWRRNLFSTLDLNLDFQGCGQIGVLKRKIEVWVKVFGSLLSTKTATTSSLPVIVYFHGGGFVLLATNSKCFDDHYQRLAKEIPAVVISVNYRLAPENQYPSQYDDGIDVLKFIDKKISTVEDFPACADLKRCFITGDSAGGNLAHNVAVRANECKFSMLMLLGVVLIQPFSEERRGEDSVGGRS